MIVFILHMMVPIEWVPYPQKECGYCGMTPKKDIYIYIYVLARSGSSFVLIYVLKNTYFVYIFINTKWIYTSFIFY